MSELVNEETGLKEIYLDPEVVKSLQRRLTCMERHIRGIRHMLAAALQPHDQESYQNILCQTLAVKAALNQVIIKVLEGHIELCLIEHLRAGGEPLPLDRLKGALNLVLKAS